MLNLNHLSDLLISQPVHSGHSKWLYRSSTTISKDVFFPQALKYVVVVMILYFVSDVNILMKPLLKNTVVETEETMHERFNPRNSFWVPRNQST